MLAANLCLLKQFIVKSKKIRFALQIIWSLGKKAVNPSMNVEREKYYQFYTMRGKFPEFNVEFIAENK